MPTDPTPPAAEAEEKAKKKRNAIFITLDDIIEAKLQQFMKRQRITPDRAAVALTALIEFLDREEANAKGKS